MHIQKCRDVVFANNHILGSRMGAFFLAEYCTNATVTGNTVDGTNGSRVMSVEKSCADVTITGNTFRGGGRGSWINQPTNFVLADNVFVNNTTKCERDPKRGRRSFTDWLEGIERDAAHTEARTDRFVAALNRKQGDPLEYSVAYSMRAVSPGKFTLPAATVEDMYRPGLAARTDQTSVEVIGPTR